MRAVAYARFSSDKQREESITAQLRAIYEYAQRQGIEIAKEYIDEAKSATTDDRPSFQQMILELNHVKPDLVLVHKYDRFARDQFDTFFYKREIQKAGARLVAVDQPLDDSPIAALMEGILVAQAEFYSRNLSHEVMKGMKENALKAKFNGGWVPLGYDIDPEGRYVINKEEAGTVRLIFGMKAQGNSYVAIIEELNRQGKKTKRGMAFGKNSIYEILRNPKYCGTYVFNETPKRIHGKRNNRVKKSDDQVIRLKGSIPALVTEDQWDKVQIMMDEMKTGPRDKGDAEIYILTGLLKCAKCGAAMVGNGSTKIIKGERRRYYYYQCNNAMRTNLCSNSKRYPKEKLENAVLKQIEHDIIRPDNEAEFANMLWSEISAINQSRDTEKIRVERELNAVKGKIDNIIMAIEDGLDYSLLGSKLKELRERKEYFESQLAERKSPFEGITRKDVLSYIRRQKGKLIPQDLQTRKSIVTS